MRRTGRDSNPRYPYGHTGFRDRPFQPLTHLSTANWRTVNSLRRTDAQGRTEKRQSTGRRSLSVLRALFSPVRLPLFPVFQHYRADRVGFEPTKRLPVYTLSRRVPSAARPPVPSGNG